MSLIRGIVVFLLGVGAAMGAYFSGAMDSLPGYFNQYFTPSPTDTPAVTTTTPTDSPATVETVQTAPGGPAPVASNGTPEAANGSYPPNAPPGYGPTAQAPAYGPQAPGYGPQAPGYESKQPDYEPPPGGYASSPSPGYQPPPDYGAKPVPVGPAPVGPSTYATLRINVRCNVHPREVPFGCAAAYGIVNRTSYPVVVTFDDPRRGPPQVLAVRPGHSVAGEPLRQAGYPYRGYEKGYPGPGGRPNGLPPEFKPGAPGSPPFVLELQECGTGEPNCVLY